MSESFYEQERPASESRADRIKRLTYRAHYTGMKETDLLLGGFAHAHLAELDDEGLEQFETLLEAGDPNIFAWIRGDDVPPVELDTPVLARIAKFRQAN